MRRLLPLLTLLVVVCVCGLAVARSGRSAAAGARVGALRPAGTTGQAVAVAYLDPGLVLALNVTSGRLELSGINLGFTPGRSWVHERATYANERDVVAIEDPLRGHTLFAYRGGIPGLSVAARAPAGAVAVPGSSAQRVWGAVRQVFRGGRLSAVVLPDGRRIGITTDGSGRAVAVRWMDARGHPLRTTMGYADGRTTITDPFGVARTYASSGEGRAYELVPAAWRRGPGYRHFYSAVLDSAAEILWVQQRLVWWAPNLTSALRPFAGSGYAGVSIDSPANGGYLDVGLTKLASARRVDAALRRGGVLDVSAIMPTYTTARQLAREGARVNAQLGSAFSDCHLSTGDGIDTFVVRVSDAITPPEWAALAHALARLDAWAIVERDHGTECLVASTAR